MSKQKDIAELNAQLAEATARWESALDHAAWLKAREDVYKLERKLKEKTCK